VAVKNFNFENQANQNRSFHIKQIFKSECSEQGSTGQTENNHGLQNQIFVFYQHTEVVTAQISRQIFFAFTHLGNCEPTALSSE